jgi:hypothetical protein
VIAVFLKAMLSSSPIPVRTRTLLCVARDPLLVYAVAITRGQSARAEMGDELIDERRAMAKYRRQSILLLVPLLVPILALARERRRAQAAQTGA